MPTQSLPQVSVPKTFRDVRDGECPSRGSLQGLLHLFSPGRPLRPSGFGSSWGQSSPAWTAVVVVVGAGTDADSGEGMGR